jgi:hypothetical protein
MVMPDSEYRAAERRRALARKLVHDSEQGDRTI